MTQDVKPGTTEKLARFIVDSSYDKMPPQAIETAKRAILDCFGVTFTGVASHEGALLIDFANELGGNPAATVIGGGFRTTAPLAALVNGTMAHAEDFDDWTFATLGHPTVPMLPAILATAEQTRASGREIVEAYVTGFEAQCATVRGVSPSHYVRGWHATGTIGTIGAAAAAAKLLKLDVEQTRMVLGLAASQAAGLRQNFGTMTKPFHAGNAARSGVMAAMLMKRGFTASPDIMEERFGVINVLKGNGAGEPESVTEGLGENYVIVTTGVTFKLYPSCGETHSTIDLVLDLARTNKVSPDDVESAEAAVEDTTASVAFYTAPKTGLEGKFSLEYCMARALLDGRVSLEHFTDEKVNEPKVKDLVRKMKRRMDPEIPPIAGSSVTIKLKDGRELSQKADAPKGSPQSPPTDDQLFSKYKNCAQLVLSPSDVDRSLDLLRNLEQLKDLTELLEIAAKPR
ncbi:MAG: MmgE/PrpD family protein [Chloroflexota bacterium]|nr:MmgE/PrpD family protein [Chloroflexota bacterium]